MIIDFLIVFVSTAYLCIFCAYAVLHSPNTNTSASCPMNLNFVLTIPWDSSACKNHASDPKTDGYGSHSTCCQTLTSLYGVGFAQHLKRTGFFRLPDLNTSRSCLSEFQAKLDSLSLPSFLTSMCFEPVKYVNSTSLCANIHTKQDWLNLLGPSTALDTGCRQDVADLGSCDACILAGFKVHSQLLSFDKNSSHARGCFHYIVLYAAGVVNELGPESMGAISCIFGLPVSLEKESNNTWKLAVIFGSAGAGVACCALLCLGGYLGWKSGKKKEKKSEELSSSDPELIDHGSWKHWKSKSRSFWFKIQDLEKATDYFSPKNFIGRGQSGMVYKGILRDGTVVAVKKLTESDFQGDAEFLNEVEIIGSLKHRNLVPLVGCCVSDRNKSYGGEIQRYLVYGYMPNGNLSEHLNFSKTDHQGNGKRFLTWPQRKSIILDVGKALAYLHYGVKPAIYHRDIKASNILLDADMRARVADFGLARQNMESESNLTTKVAGTYGYIAPEYALYGQLTEKSDVYSFGVVILETVSGRKAIELSSSGSSSGTFLVTDWAWSLVKAGRVEEIFDPSLLANAESVSKNQKKIMERFVLVGILCAHLMVALRPTILDALKMLEGDTEVPEILDRPTYAHKFTLHSANSSSRHLMYSSTIV